MIKQESRQRLVEDKMSFEYNQEVLVNALDLCDEVFSHDKLKRMYAMAMERIDLLETVIALKECNEYRRFDIKA